MKGLRRFFGSRVETKNETLESPVRLQVLGMLEVYLAHTFEAPAKVTQFSMAVTPLIPDDTGVHCDVVVMAFFYWEGMQKPLGGEGKALLPPRVSAEIRLHSNNTRVLSWEIDEFKNVETSDLCGWRNAGFKSNDPLAYVSSLAKKMREFVSTFNRYRPMGYSVMDAGHDHVIWEINPKPGHANTMSPCS